MRRAGNNLGKKGVFPPKSVQTFFAGSTAGVAAGAALSGVAGVVCAGVATASGLSSGDAAAFAAMLGVFVIFIFFLETRQRYAADIYVGAKHTIYNALHEVPRQIARLSSGI